MFEKLSQAMKGNQNARKNPLALGTLATVSASGLAMLDSAARRVADSKAAISDFKRARSMKKNSNAAVLALRVDALKQLLASGKSATTRLADFKAAGVKITEKIARADKLIAPYKDPAIATLKAAAADGLKAGARKYGPFAAGLGVGTAAATYVGQKRNERANRPYNRAVRAARQGRDSVKQSINAAKRSIVSAKIAAGL